MRRPEELELGGTYTLRNGDVIQIATDPMQDLIVHKDPEGKDHINGQCTKWVRRIGGDSTKQWYIADGPLIGWVYQDGRNSDSKEHILDIVFDDRPEMEQLDLFQ